ncbi:uncharacterized protein LOC115670033 [Syzygium oleosum]|uniref:uncharacterized protein LOC115670033 n=1 Tax=Syzygium oleosum TaxID=219896 RepID=UPI0024BA0AC4|nr:uncharacterized protein LOC115670033 [Syzygium oleosum]
MVPDEALGRLLTLQVYLQLFRSIRTDQGTIDRSIWKDWIFTFFKFGMSIVSWSFYFTIVSSRLSAGFMDEPALLLSLQVFMCRDQSRMLWYELLVQAKKIRPDKASVFSAGLVHIFPLCGGHYVTVQGWHIGQHLIKGL